MVAVHLTLGIAVIAANLAAGIVGGYAWYARKPSVRFWYLLRFAQVVVVLQLAVGGLLLLFGNEAADSLHYVYGVLPVMVTLLAEGARGYAGEQETEGLDFEALPRERQIAVAAAISRRETGIMTVSALVILGLALRAAFLSSVI